MPSIIAPGDHRPPRLSKTVSRPSASKASRQEERMDTARVAAALIQVVNFDSSAAGALPDGWKAGVTGAGNPRWSVERDATAPSPPNVLKQSGSGAFPWCVKDA